MTDPTRSSFKDSNSNGGTVLGSVDTKSFSDSVYKRYPTVVCVCGHIHLTDTHEGPSLRDSGTKEVIPRS